MIFSNISSIDRGKGLEVYIDAIARLPHKEDDRFDIVGKASETNRDYERELRRKVAQKELDPYVVFTGFVTDMAAYLKGVDVVVLTSTVEEAFGLVLIEGMARGKIVIASNVGGVREIVEEGDGNRLVPPGDADALAEAILEVRSYTPRQKALIASRNVERVRRKFTLRQQIETMSDLYKRICLR